MAITDNRKRRLVEMQGFVAHDDNTVKHLDYALRLSPIICMVLTAVATATESVTLLWLLLPFAIGGAVLHNHPFDVLYNHGLRYITGGPALPRYPMPRRFACMMASVWITAEAICFIYGMPLAAQLLGWSLVITAAVPVTTGFCVPSFLYGLMFGKPQLAASNVSS